MKVLHVIPYYNRRDGGPSEVIKHLLPALARTGVSSRLVTSDKGTDFGEQVPWVDSFVTKSGWPARWMYAKGMFAILRREIGWADVVHVHTIHSYPSTVTMWLCRTLRTPYVLQPHGALTAHHMRKTRILKMAYARTIDRIGIRRAFTVVVSSSRELRETNDSLAQCGHHPRIDILPLGVDPSIFAIERANESSAQPTVLFLSRIAQKKRLDLAIRAMNEPPMRNIPALLLVGGQVASDLTFDPQELAAELGISDRVLFLGLASAETRRTLLRDSDVFVLPSDDESFGIAAAEALAAGCPIVVSREVGLAEDAGPNPAIFLADREAGNLSEALAEVLAIPDGSAVSAAGREYAKANFDWNLIAVKLFGIYGQTLQAKSGVGLGPVKTFRTNMRYAIAALVNLCGRPQVVRATRQPQEFISGRRLRFALLPLIFLLPASRGKNLLLRRCGAAVGPSAKIGPCLVKGVSSISLGVGSQIGPLNVFWNLTSLELGEESVIGRLNWFSASPVLVGTGGLGSFSIGRHSAITSRHYLDCSGGVQIGEMTTVAGVRSTFITHGIDWRSNRQKCRGIRVGSYCLIGSNSAVVPGTEVEDRVVTGMGATLSGRLQERSLHVGSRAQPVKVALPGEFFCREVGYTEV